MAEKRYRGTCAVCRMDLYRDPLLHYTSQSHADAAARWERRVERERAAAERAAAERAAAERA